MLKSQDVFVLLKLVVQGRNPWIYAGMAVQLGMSPSHLHSSVKRALSARLAVREGKQVRPLFRNLEEFLVHGLKYVFWGELGGVTRGVPTAYGARPLCDVIVVSKAELPPVWPDPEGTVRGVSLEPLYRMVPHAARQDKKLYELLALVDALRIGRARERAIATEELKKRWEYYASAYKS